MAEKSTRRACEDRRQRRCPTGHNGHQRDLPISRSRLHTAGFSFDDRQIPSESARVPPRPAHARRVREFLDSFHRLKTKYKDLPPSSAWWSSCENLGSCPRDHALTFTLQLTQPERLPSAPVILRSAQSKLYAIEKRLAEASGQSRSEPHLVLVQTRPSSPFWLRGYSAKSSQLRPDGSQVYPLRALPAPGSSVLVEPEAYEVEDAGPHSCCGPRPR